jgi:hypothetical protein
MASCRRLFLRPGYEAKKTEHCGPKRGRGAYYGYKWEAKKESNRIRHENAKRDIRDAGADEVLMNSPNVPRNGD